MDRDFLVFVCLMFASSGTAYIGEKIEIGADLGLNITKIRQDLKECNRLLRILDSNRTVNSSTALGMLSLRTGFTEYVAYFRSNQPCARTAFDEVTDAVFFGAETYSECVNAFPARPANATTRPVSIYTYFRKCFQTIFNMNSATARECSTYFNTGVQNFLFGRVNVTLVEEIRVGKCADTAMNEVIDKLNVTVSIYKDCRGTEVTTATPTTQGSTVPPYFAVINAALTRFQDSYSVSINRLQTLVGKSVTDVSKALEAVKAINVTESTAAIASTEDKVKALIRALTTRETTTEQQQNCANVAYVELNTLATAATGNIRSCVTQAIANITALYDEAVINEVYVTSQINNNGRSAIIRCANSLYGLADEPVRCCAETVLANFSKYLNERSIIDIDNALTLANNAIKQEVSARKCIDNVNADFNQKATTVFSAFRSCGGYP